MASSKEKAVGLKDAYVSDLISKGHGKQPEIKMPEVNHGDVAIEPLTMAVGAAIAGATALWHTPEIMEAGKSIVGDRAKEDPGRHQNDKQNRGRLLLNQLGIGNYNSNNYDREHFRKTGKARPMSDEQIRCYNDAYCRN